MATISQIKTKRVFFSIRWKILIAFLLIFGVAFYSITTLMINRVGDYLFQEKVTTERTTVNQLSTELAPIFSRGDAEALHAAAVASSRRLNGRILVIDMDGKVQMDTQSEANGKRLSHPEIVSVLNGAQSDYGFHLVSDTSTREDQAFFDFMRNQTSGVSWAGYFTYVLSVGREPIGVVLYSVTVQQMVDSLRVIQDQLLLIFLIAAVAVFIMSLVFTRVITKPIGALTEGIKRMGRGDMSARVKVSGVDEMARLGETFNQMSDRLENLDTSRNEFVSNASHELKTPLATMKIMLESMLYQDDMPLELRQEFLTDINKELDRLSNIVTDLLTLVQSDSKDYMPVRKTLSLGDLAQDTVHRLEPLAVERKHKIALNVQPGIEVFADQMKLQQVIYNLVDNAIKYTPQGGKIRVSVRQEGKDAVLEVSDNGPGIPKKDQAHIFDRFYRVDRARSRATGGNGLGLSIVHQAVIMHDGSVTVHSEEGKGTTFRVELPTST